MLPELAIGDAYGAAFEFAAKPPKNDLNYHAHPSRKDDLHKGEYTDDTQMSIAIVEHMLSKDICNQYHIVKHFLKEFKRHPIDGYARRFQKFLEDTKTANAFIRTISPNSFRNGAAMRAVPIGVLPTWQDVSTYTITQASSTHATIGGIISAQLVAAASHYYYHRLEGTVYGFIEKCLGTWATPLKKNDKGPIACDGLQTAFAAIRLCMKYSKMTTILKHAIDLGGDTDSTASIALGLVSLSVHHKKDLPKYLYDELSSRGRRPLGELEALEEALFTRFPRIQ